MKRIRVILKVVMLVDAFGFKHILGNFICK